MLGLAGCTGLFQRDLPEAADRFVRTAAGPYRVGVAKADITPEGDIYLGGFDLNRKPSRVESALEVSAFVLECGTERIAIVGIDNLGLQRHDVDWIKEGIAGFAKGSVFLCSSHTHAGPDLIGMWGMYMLTSGRDHDYAALVRQRVLEVVARAAANTRAARLFVGESRMPAVGFARNTNRAGVFDRRVTVLQARGATDDAPIGSLIHLACHPEVLRRGDTLVSPDFVGPMRDRHAAAGLGQAVFVNGALGAMITPKPHGESNLPKVGAFLHDIVMCAIHDAEPIEVEELEVRRRDVYLPMESWALRLGRLTTVIPRHLYDGALRCSVGYLRIGTFEACCLPGEAEPGYARRIVAASGRRRLHVFGLVDDEVGYLMTERDAHDPLFGYERMMSPGVEAGEIVLRALVR